MAQHAHDDSLETFIAGLPKAELHLHLEGTLESELLLTIAERNGIRTKYAAAEQLRAAYVFGNLQDFLDIYYEGTRVLRTEADFYDLTYAYLQKARSQEVLHAEVQFDPQAHTVRGVPFPAVIEGIHAALVDGERNLGITSRLILCFLRHLDEKAAFETFQAALRYREWITAIGLDSSERGNPPSKFAAVYCQARGEGFHTIAHAGEEGPAAYIAEALKVLGVDRVDHGNHALDDPHVTAELARRQIPLTLCPLSNLKLKVVEDLADHCLKRMMQQGLLVTVNSDDPAYFGGYVNENYAAIVGALSLTQADLSVLAKNSFIASFMPGTQRARLVSKVDAYIAEHNQLPRRKSVSAASPAPVAPRP